MKTSVPYPEPHHGGHPNPLPRLLAMLVLVVPLMCGAQDPSGISIEPGRLYEGPQRLFAPAYGTGFDLPSGWRGLHPPGAEMFLMERPGKAGLLVILGAGGSDAEITRALAGNIPLDAQTVLSPIGPTETTEGVHSNRFDVQGNASLVGFGIAKLFDSGVGIGVLSVGPGKDTELETAARTVFNSLGYEKPSGPTLADGTLWSDYLAGKKLEYLVSDGGRRHDIMRLCRDGSVFRRNSGSSFGGLGVGTAASQAGGRWQVEGFGGQATLHIQLHNGDSARWRLSRPGGKLHLDGQRWFITRGDC
ncbi:MAG: hypothetical protein ACPGU7_10600 [Gammaproteobacteria bacterium]